MKTVITDAWGYGYDSEKNYVFGREEPRLSETEETTNESKQSENAVDHFLRLQEVFIVHCVNTPPGQVVNKQYYSDILRLLQVAICRKGKRLRVSGERKLHHDNTFVDFAATVYPRWRYK